MWACPVVYQYRCMTMVWRFVDCIAGAGPLSNDRGIRLQVEYRKLMLRKAK